MNLKFWKGKNKEEVIKKKERKQVVSERKQVVSERKPISVFKSNDLLIDRMRRIRERERENMLYEDLVGN
jgi:hypothetical protein